FARQDFLTMLVHADRLHANAIAVPDHFGHFHARGDCVAGTDGFDELQRLREIDRARAWKRGADDRGDEARSEDARRDRRLEHRAGRVRQIAVHGIVVTDGANEARDVSVTNDARDLRAIPGLKLRDRLSDHPIWPAPRRRSTVVMPSSSRSRRSSRSMICLASDVTCARVGRLKACSVASMDWSLAFFAGA